MPRNIRLGWEGGLETKLCTLQQGNIDITVIQETKIMWEIHTHYWVGYSVWETHVDSRHQEEVAVACT